MSDQVTTNSSDGVHVRPCVLSIMDLLGQSRELRQWNTFADTSDHHRLAGAIRDTLGIVVAWREVFEKTFNGFLKSLAKAEETLAPKIPGELRKQFEKFRETEILHHHFSDSLIFYSPLVNMHNYQQVSNVAVMIVTCGSSMLSGLAHEIPLRGAIEIGMLAEFPSGSDNCAGGPYGPALADAHRLESKVAQYPRVVVGPRLLAYLDSIEADTEDTPSSRANRANVADFRQFLARDEDGQWIIDYLGDAFAGIGDNPELLRTAQAEAFKFIQTALARFRANNDRQVVAKYERLEAYFRRNGSYAQA